MTSKFFRRSRRTQRKTRRGGNVALLNAASASALPVGLTLLQQHFKNKTARKMFKPMRKFRKFMTPKN
jgi:hypothetical protein